MATTDPGAIRIGWRPRSAPLEPVAVAAAHAAAKRLAERLLHCGEDRLRLLKGVAGPEVILILGAADALPWTRGVRYLGRIEGNNPLLLPTTHEPDVPFDLFEAAVKRRFPSGRYPLAILPDYGIALSVAEARPLSRQTLLRWLEGNP